MRHFLWAILVITATATAYGQHTEFSFQAGSGLFSFRGPGAASETSFEISDVSSIPSKLDNPYGRNSGLSYSLAGQVQRITKNRFIYGTQAGFESLANKVTITRVIGGFSDKTTNDRATLRYEYINLHPFIGQRFGNERLSLDATAGLDVGFSLSEYQTIQLTGSSLFLINDPNRTMPAIDVRPRLNLTGNYRAFGLSFGYSHGLTAYVNSPYSTAKAYSRMWRIGVVYRV